MHIFSKTLLNMQNSHRNNQQRRTEPQDLQQKKKTETKNETRLKTIRKIICMHAKVVQKRSNTAHTHNKNVLKPEFETIGSLSTSCLKYIYFCLVFRSLLYVNTSQHSTPQYTPPLIQMEIISEFIFIHSFIHSFLY